MIFNVAGGDMTAVKNYTNTVVRAAAPVNLLDNSDFTRPVNQRGKTTYTGAVYGIDRWQGMSRTVVAVGDGVVNLSNSTPTAGVAYWQQPIPEEVLSQSLVGTHTLAVKLDGVVYCGSGVPGTDLGFYIGSINVTVLYSSSLGEYVCRVELPQGDSQVHALAWIALYPGAYTADTLPEYRPKGYAAELAACRRYYYRIPANMRWPVVGISANTMDFLVSIPDMRTVPTIDTTALAVQDMAGTTKSGFALSVQVSADRYAVVIRATKTAHGMTSARLQATGVVSLIADL